MTRGVAQPGSATVWGTGGRVFESRLPDKRMSYDVLFFAAAKVLLFFDIYKGKFTILRQKHKKICTCQKKVVPLHAFLCSVRSCARTHEAENA